jgi:hypothetical protein
LFVRKKSIFFSDTRVKDLKKGDFQNIKTSIKKIMNKTLVESCTAKLFARKKGEVVLGENCLG